MPNRHIYFVAVILTLSGLAIFAYKTLVAGFPIMPGARTSAWDIEARITFEGTGSPVKVKTFVPRSRHDLQIQDLRFVAPGYGVSRSELPENQQIVLATRQAHGPQALYVKFLAHRFITRDKPPLESEPRPDRPKLDDASRAAADELIRRAREKSADTRTFVTALLKILGAESREDGVLQILGRRRTPAARSDAGVALLALAGIGARRVNGIDLTGPRKDARLLRWIEVFDNGRWVGFSVPSGEANIPSSYLPWWYGTQRFVTVAGGGQPTHKLSLVRLQNRTLDAVLAEGRLSRSQLVTLSLFGLPLATQEVYRVLMVVPLGIFILVIIRNVIGLRSLGTFMPVLIALAFRETELLWGIILFSSVVGAGLLFRAYLEYLKLLLVPRLASVLIFVVIFMAGLSVVTGQLGLQGGLSIALFPMVIMTMTIERISVIWDELGPAAALKQAAGSLAVAALCYLLMSQPVVEHVFFTFPELLIVLLAGTMLLGRYSGYRLLELPRFKVLAGDDK